MEVFIIFFMIVLIILGYFSGVFSPSETNNLESKSYPKDSPLMLYDMLDGTTVPLDRAGKFINQKYSEDKPYNQTEDYIDFIYHNLSSRSKTLIKKKEIFSILAYEDLKTFLAEDIIGTIDNMDEDMSLELLKAHQSEVEQLDKYVILEVKRLEYNYLVEIGKYEINPYSWIVDKVFEQLPATQKQQLTKDKLILISDIFDVLEIQDIKDFDYQSIKQEMEYVGIVDITQNDLKVIFQSIEKIVQSHQS